MSGYPDSGDSDVVTGTLTSVETDPTVEPVAVTNSKKYVKDQFHLEAIGLSTGFKMGQKVDIQKSQFDLEEKIRIINNSIRGYPGCEAIRWKLQPVTLSVYVVPRRFGKPRHLLLAHMRAELWDELATFLQGPYAVVEHEKVLNY